MVGYDYVEFFLIELFEMERFMFNLDIWELEIVIILFIFVFLGIFYFYLLRGRK